MKMAVIVSDYSLLCNVGGELERQVKVFDLPDEIAEYIKTWQAGKWSNCSLALVDEEADRE